jgi:hypothetical protein
MELSSRRFLPPGIGRILDQCSDQTQQLYVQRPIASLAKKRANFNVGRLSARGLIRNVSDKNAPDSGSRASSHLSPFGLL